jgi:predicted outer membrane repeat protein
MLRYFRGLFHGLGTAGPARRARPPRRCRPRLEALEDRLAPARLTVTDGGDSLADPQSLRHALGQAKPGDVIDFAPAVQKISLRSGLEVRTSVRIVNDQGTGPVAIDGGGAVTPFTVDAGVTASLAGLTIADGKAPLDSVGGGIFNRGTLDLTNCTLSANHATLDGGGIYNDGALTLTNCTLAGNSADIGGGISNDGALTLTHCTLSHNSATTNGGGIETEGAGSLALRSCTLSDNCAGAAGGGIYNPGVPALTLTSCTLAGNSALGGGGIANGGTLTLTNCTLAANTAVSDGGGISNSGVLALTSCTLSGNSASDVGGGIENQGTLTLTNCTLAANTANCGGGGIDNGIGRTLTLTSCTLAGNSTHTFTLLSGGGIENGGTALLHNSIVAGNFNGLPGRPADDILGTVDPSSSFNLIGTGGSGGLSNGINHNLVGVSNPGLASLADNGGPTGTIALLSSSPALGAGDPALLGTTDQRGFIRTGSVNIGAYQDPPPAPSTYGAFGGYPSWNPWNPGNPGTPRVERMM